MRKLAFFLLSLIAVIGFYNAADAGECAKKKLGTFSNTDSNEYLYQSDSDYRSGNVFECQSSQCAHGMLIFVKTGHILDGYKINKNKLYQCRTGVDDRWVDYNVTDLSDCDKVKCKITQTTPILDGWYIIDKAQGDSGISRQTGEQLLVQTETSVCKCEGPKPVEQPAKPEKTATPVKTTPKAPKTGGTGSVESTPAVVADTGIYQCDAKTIEWVFKMRTEYSSDTAITALIDKIIEFCEKDNSRTYVVFKKHISSLEILIEKNDSAREAELQRQRNIDYTTTIKTIETISSDIKKVTDGLDVTVWKNAEGKFNTSRLVSDSVAGVVLGTAGGLITSSVVKKNQIKSGFEDINCTVGGQVVAGWGDEFNVGIR